jgi:hypothetical protein
MKLLPPLSGQISVKQKTGNLYGNNKGTGSGDQKRQIRNFDGEQEMRFCTGKMEMGNRTPWKVQPQTTKCHKPAHHDII